MSSSQLNDDILRHILGLIAAPLFDWHEQDRLTYESVDEGDVVAYLKGTWAAEDQLALCASVSPQFHTLSVELLYRERRLLPPRTLDRITDAVTQQQVKARLVGWFVTVARRPDLAALVRCVGLPSTSALGTKIWGIRHLFQSLETLDVSVEYLVRSDPSYDGQTGSLPNPATLVVHGIRDSEAALFPAPAPDQSLDLSRRVGTSRLQSLTTKEWGLIGREEKAALLPRSIRAVPPVLTTLNLQHGEAWWLNIANLLSTHGASLYHLRITVDVFVLMKPPSMASKKEPTLRALCPRLETFGFCTDIIYLTPPTKPDSDDEDAGGGGNGGSGADADADVVLAAEWLYTELLHDGLPHLRHYEISRGHLPKLVPNGPLGSGNMFTAASFVKAIHDGGLLPSLECVTLHGCSFDRPINEGPDAPTWDDVELLQVDGVVVFDGDGRKWV